MGTVLPNTGFVATPPSVRCTEVGMTAQPNLRCSGHLGQIPDGLSKPAWLLGLRCFARCLGQKPLSRANPHGYCLCPTLGHLFRSFSFIKEEKNNSNKSSNKGKGSSKCLYVYVNRRFWVSQASRAPLNPVSMRVSLGHGHPVPSHLGTPNFCPEPFTPTPSSKKRQICQKQQGRVEPM